eukprot:6096320-Amphidinium_carterae.1
MLRSATPRHQGADPREVLHDPKGPDSCLFQCVAYHLWSNDAPSQVYALRALTQQLLEEIARHPHQSLQTVLDAAARA